MATFMDARRHGQEGHLPSKIVATRHVSLAHNVPKCDLTGELTALPKPLAVFNGSASLQRRKGRVDRARGKERGGEEKNGATGEGIEMKGRR